MRLQKRAVTVNKLSMKASVLQPGRVLQIDDEVLAALLVGAKVMSIVPLAEYEWAQAVKVDMQLVDGAFKSYLLMVSFGLSD